MPESNNNFEANSSVFVIDTTLMPQIAVKLKLEQVRKGSPVFGFASSRILVRAGTCYQTHPGHALPRTASDK